MKRVKLRSKFVLLLSVVSLVPLVITALLTFVRFQNTLQQDAVRLGNQLTATAAAEIKSFVVSQIRILDSVATVYTPEFSANPGDAKKIVENILYRSTDFNDIAVVNQDGKEIIRQNRILVITPEDLRDLKDTEPFKIVQQRGIYVGPLYIEGGRPQFELGRWIVGSQGNFTGAVFAKVDAKILPQVTRNISAIAGPGGRVYLVNEQGVVIAHPDLSYILSEKNLSQLPPVSNIVAGRASTEAPQTYKNENDDEVVGSASAVRIELIELGLPKAFQLNWFVIAEQQSSVVFAEAYRSGLFSALTALIMVLAAIAAAVFFAGRISKPIETLYNAALEFGKGNLKYRARVNTNDEIGDLAGSFNGMAGRLENSIKDLREQEKIITAERNQLSIILSGITNAVIAVDLERKIILFNKAAEILTGRKADAVMGKSVEQVIKIFNEQTAVPVKEYCPTGKSNFAGTVFSKNNLRLVTGPMEERYVNLVSSTIREGLSIKLGCILTFQDTTREFLMEKMKGEFVSVAAHQLRTPLTGIKWSLQYLVSGEVGKLNRDQQSIVGDASVAANRMTDLVNDLLDVSRIEEGRYGIEMKKQSIVPLLKHLMDEFHSSASQKGITLKMDLPDQLPLLNIDEEKLEIALNNLCDNAIKYTFPGKTVQLKAVLSKQGLTISVTDEGIGIPQSEFDRIFSKFFRSSQALLHHTSGTGLGLYVTKNIVEQHGGKIWFESKENIGTTFYISLPLV